MQDEGHTPGMLLLSKARKKPHALGKHRGAQMCGDLGNLPNPRAQITSGSKFGAKKHLGSREKSKRCSPPLLCVLITL